MILTAGGRIPTAEKDLGFGMSVRYLQHYAYVSGVIITVESTGVAIAANMLRSLFSAACQMYGAAASRTVHGLKRDPHTSLTLDMLEERWSSTLRTNSHFSLILGPSQDDGDRPKSSK